MWAGTTTCSLHFIMGVNMGVMGDVVSSGRRRGRRDVVVGVGTSSWRRYGRRGVGMGVGPSTWPSGRRRGRRDVDRAVGTSGRPNVLRSKVRYRNLYRRVL